MVGRKKRHRQRGFVRHEGPFQFVHLGIDSFTGDDIYHWLLSISWWRFFAIVCGAYFVINFAFAIAYLAGSNGIENARPGSFMDAFFFSIQTMATIGYGAMYPSTAYTHFLVAVEVLVGLLAVAMATSLMFARFALPKARIIFSRAAVICPYNGVPTLMFRVANQRNNWIVEGQIRVSFLLPAETTTEGHQMRRLTDLKLERSQTPILTLTWLVMHTIDETSPLYGIDLDNIAEYDPQIIVSFTGLDETLSQTIHARTFYLPDDLAWNRKFVDVVSINPNGRRCIDYTHFHDTIALEEM